MRADKTVHFRRLPCGATTEFNRCYQIRNILVQTPKIVLLSVCAAMGFGILHDLITAHICVEYFTITHPSFLHVQSPVLLALIWGALGTFWIGLVFGVPLARASQSSGLPTMTVSGLSKAIFVLLAVTSITAVPMGFVGFELSRCSLVAIPATWSEKIPPSQNHRFMAVWFAHAASHVSGIFGGAWLIFRIWNKRCRPRIISIFPRRMLELFRVGFLLAVLSLIAWLRFG